MLFIASLHILHEFIRSCSTGYKMRWENGGGEALRGCSLSYNCSIRWDALDNLCQQASQSSFHPLYKNPIVVAVWRKKRDSIVNSRKPRFVNSVRVYVRLNAASSGFGLWSTSILHCFDFLAFFSLSPLITALSFLSLATSNFLEQHLM